MGEEDELFSSMALPVIVLPVLDNLEDREEQTVRNLKASFTRVEQQHPGFTLNLVWGILRKAKVETKVDMSECLLRLGANSNSNEFDIGDGDESMLVLAGRAKQLRQILARIPDEIYDRKKFLETIKDIASAIRLLLDSVNNIYINIPEHYKPELETRKREFVRYSRNFSNTLKDFFRDNERQCVYVSANHLRHQTNLLIKLLQSASR